MVSDSIDRDCEFGDVPARAVEWLLSRGHLTSDDCSMNVACGRGGFSRPMSRAVRVLVCMDRDRSALDVTGARCEGGCRTELFERDWNSYVPSRGRYDSVLISPSYLCYSRDSLLRAETVSSRSCAVVFPMVHDYRSLRKAVLRSIGFNVSFPGFPDYRPFVEWLSDEGRDHDSTVISTDIECPLDLFCASLSRDCIARGAPADTVEDSVRTFAESLLSGDVVRIRFEACIVAWNVKK